MLLCNKTTLILKLNQRNASNVLNVLRHPRWNWTVTGSWLNMCLMCYFNNTDMNWYWILNQYESKNLVTTCYTPPQPVTSNTSTYLLNLHSTHRSRQSCHHVLPPPPSKKSSNQIHRHSGTSTTCMLSIAISTAIQLDSFFCVFTITALEPAQGSIMVKSPSWSFAIFTQVYSNTTYVWTVDWMIFLIPDFQFFSFSTHCHSLITFPDPFPPAQITPWSTDHQLPK